jgi:hypothetical protein
LGWHFHVIQLSWSSRDISGQRRQLFESRGLHYRSIPVLRRPKSVGALLTSLLASLPVFWYLRRWRIDVIMPRSILPGLTTLVAAGWGGTPVVYHSDGLAADEKVDNEGLSRSSVAYRILRLIESRVTARASVVLSLTKFGQSVLASRTQSIGCQQKFYLVTNGKEPTVPAPLVQNQDWEDFALKDERRFTVCYLGSWGPQYRPLRMLSFVAYLKTGVPELEFLILTGDVLAAHLAVDSFFGPHCDWIRIDTVTASGVGISLGHCALGLSFREPTYSSRAVSPIKIGEYLNAGIPVIGDATGDSGQELVARGVLIEPDQTGDKAALNWVMGKVQGQREEMREQCRAAGLDYFGIQKSVEDYHQALTFVILQ